MSDENNPNGQPGPALFPFEGNLPDGVEMVYQVMLPVSVQLGCKECKQVMEPVPINMALITQNNQRPMPRYVCPGCGNSAMVPAQLPMTGFFPQSGWSSSPPVMVAPENETPAEGEDDGEASSH